MLRRRYIAQILLILILALACSVASARAASTQGSARAKAAATKASAIIKATKIQEADCVWGFPFLYACVHSYYVFPSCWETKINQPGHPQHVCGGVFVRQNRVSKNIQFCDETIFLSPWNRELRPSGYKCHATSPLT
jgi:hypothetical protein